MKYTSYRDLLWRCSPEMSHFLAMHLLDAFATLHLTPLLVPKPVDDPIELMGIHFKNRVGLAAGMDKNARHSKGLATLGFGFIELGTVTPLPQPGNPQPRLFRLPQSKALINRMGFNSLGLIYFRERLAKLEIDIPLGVNLGKNAITPIVNAEQDYMEGMQALYPFANYFAINISSPNTQGLRKLQSPDYFSTLINTLQSHRSQLNKIHHKYVPLLIKLSPDLEHEQIEMIARTMLKSEIDGLIVSNTSLSRENLSNDPHQHETGGLSGMPIFDRSTLLLKNLRGFLGKHITLIGVGGIHSAQQALEKIQAGADLVQLYTGFVYEGPELISACAKALKQVHN